jgi:hypothetical protein
LVSTIPVFGKPGSEGATILGKREINRTRRQIWSQTRRKNLKIKASRRGKKRRKEGRAPLTPAKFKVFFRGERESFSDKFKANR